MRQETASDEFAQLTDPFRGELLAYCYRMLGSVHDAEDQVQEVMLRAWRGRDGFEGRASMRTWLYRIATNACLRALETRARRPLPSGLGGPLAELPDGPIPVENATPWLQPFPTDPAAVVASHDGIRLALIAALQYLPARQRAVLILRDVLGWRAAEVAALLGTTTVAVNSALQRARTQLEQAAPAQDRLAEPADPAVRALLDQYAAAFETSDVASLTRLLHEEATFEMPPISLWLAGRENIADFLGARVLGKPGDWRLLPAHANGQPAFATYLRDHDAGEYRAHAIMVLTAGPAAITGVVSFNDASLFTPFGFPESLLAGSGLTRSATGP